MSNFMLGWNNRVKNSSLETSSFVTGMDPSQLKDDQGSSATAWQTTRADYAGLRLDAGTSVTWRVVGLFKTNLTAAAMLTIRIGDDYNATSYAGGFSGSASVQPGYGQSVIVMQSEIVGRYCLIEIADPTNSDGFINIPLLYAGPVLQPVRNFDYQSAPGRSNQLVRADTRSGGAILRTDWIKRTFDLSLSSLTATEIMAVQDMDFIARQGSNILLVPNPESTTVNRDALFGELAPAAGFGYVNAQGRLRSYRATMTERL